MGFFDLFRRKSGKTGGEESAKNQQEERLRPYSGMRVEVTTMNGQELFIAKLVHLQGDMAQLHQYTAAEIPPELEEAAKVRIRGYSDKEEKAVYLEGVITLRPERIWTVENLTLLKRENDRAFFRVDTDIDALARPVSNVVAEGGPCKLLNISVGGACISSKSQYREKERLLLNVKLMEERDVSLLLCEVLRITKKENAVFEYGCRFLEMGEADAQKVAQVIFDLQREKALTKTAAGEEEAAES